MQIDTLTTLEDAVHQSHIGTIDFGGLVPRLVELGIESYHVDYRRGETVYRWASGHTHVLRSIRADGPVAAAFAVAAVRDAIAGAQRGDVLYPEFVRLTVAAGCVGYDVWLSGRHVVYHGRRGEQWIERFPGGPPTRPAVEVVRRIYGAFARRDLAAAIALLSGDIEILQSHEVAWGGHHRGHEGARTFFARLGAALDSTLALERFIDAGEHVVAVGRTCGVARASGRPYDVPISHVWTVRDGLAVRAEFYIDNPTMLAALT